MRNKFCYRLYYKNGKTRTGQYYYNFLSVLKKKRFNCLKSVLSIGKLRDLHCEVLFNSITQIWLPRSFHHFRKQNLFLWFTFVVQSRTDSGCRRVVCRISARTNTTGNGTGLNLLKLKLIFLKNEIVIKT